MQILDGADEMTGFEARYAEVRGDILIHRGQRRSQAAYLERWKPWKPGPATGTSW